MTGKRRSIVAVVTAVLWVAVCRGMGGSPAVASDATLDVDQGVCVVLGLPDAADPSSLVRLADGNRRKIYFQSADGALVAAVRQAAHAAHLLGSRIFVEHGDIRSVHLADNLADGAWVAPQETASTTEAEILRMLHPGATAVFGDRVVVKPPQEGVDDWSHPYHTPDNNPCSTDLVARAPFRTQFLAGPLFSPMPEVTVAAAGRVFKAFGHLAHKANQNEVLNSLLCINAYNGTILWRRELRAGFMIHRNTMIATPDTLYLADDESCKLIDAATGAIRDEIVVPPDLSDGPVWKWMALRDGVLYALVGGAETRVDTIRSTVGGIGHWGWGMWQGHDYADPRTNFGFGRTFLALDPRTKEVLWTYRDEDYLDSRGVCMNLEQIFFYSPEKFLGCLRVADGSPLWKNRDPDLLAAIGPNGAAQDYVSGYATQTYMKCDDQRVYFAGPQRPRLVVASADDGRLLWQRTPGNLQLVLRDDGFYCVGPEQGAEDAGAKYSFDGVRLVSLPKRRACTRATGGVDSVFYRATGGTVRLDTETNRAEHIAPMRPPCQDGVIISDGLLFWGPWMCGCQLSLYGHICLGPADAPRSTDVVEPQLQQWADASRALATWDLSPGDWPAYQHDSWRSSYTAVEVPESVRQAWTCRVTSTNLPTAPVMAGGWTFVADRDGAVRALDEQGQQVWIAHMGGPVYYPPAVADGRLLLGSADGRVYALEAATGRLLWSYRVAPEARWIPVYDALMSTWPVAGGVVVEDGVVYAAAGISHFDGTHVVALDAATGRTRWRNDSSGRLSSEVNCGISLQGELMIRGHELWFLGGGDYLFARYDLRTGQCLNEPQHDLASEFQTAFYPYYPMYAKYASLFHTFRDGRTLKYAASYDGSDYSPLQFLEPAAPIQAAPARQAAKPRAAALQRKEEERKPVWETARPQLYTAFVITPNTLLAAGPDPDLEGRPTLWALRLADGSPLWETALPALPVKAGLAIDRRQHITVSMENGEVLCLVPDHE